MDFNHNWTSISPYTSANNYNTSINDVVHLQTEIRLRTNKSEDILGSNLKLFLQSICLFISIIKYKINIQYWKWVFLHLDLNKLRGYLSVVIYLFPPKVLNSLHIVNSALIISTLLLGLNLYPGNEILFLEPTTRHEDNIINLTFKEFTLI